MKILVDKGKLLDTEINQIIDGNEKGADQKHLKKPILYNIILQGSSKYCSICYNLKILNNVPYEKAIAKVSKMDYVELNDNTPEQEIESEAKVEVAKKSTNTDKTINGIPTMSQDDYLKKVKEEVEREKVQATKISTSEIFSKDLSPEERAKIREKYLKDDLYKSNRLLDTANSSADITELDKRARVVVLEAKKIVKNRYPFYYLILNKLNERYSKTEVKTMAVTPGFIYYNPDFVLERSVKELVFVLCHETMHIILKHHPRLKSRNAKLWNLAGDMIINLMLADEFDCSPNKEGKDAEFPHGGIYYNKIDLHKDTTETLYDRLLEQNQNNPFSQPSSNQGQSSSDGESDDSDLSGDNGDNQEDENESQENNSSKNSKGKGKGKGKQQKEKQTVNLDGQEIDISDIDCEDVREDSNSADKSEDELDRRETDMIRRAISEAKAAGIGDGCAGLRMFEEMDQPEPPMWVDKIKPYLKALHKHELLYNQSYKNRITRLTNYRAIYPGTLKKKDTIKNLLLAIDTSGSIDQPELQSFYNQTKGLLSSLKHVKGTVCAWDDKVNNSEEFKSWEEFKKFQPKGYGGTQPECIFPWAKEHDCKYLVIYTDGEFYNKLSPDLGKDFAVVIWVLFTKEQYRRFDPPFGIKCI